MIVSRPFRFYIRQVRRKLQAERLSLGVSILLAGALVASVVASWLLVRSNFSDGTILGLQVGLGLLILLLVTKFIILPLVRRPNQLQVARFIEERHPELRNRLSTAIEVSRPSSTTDPQIKTLIRQDASRKMQQVQLPRLLHRERSLLSLLTIFTTGIIFVALFLGGPHAFRFSLGKLLSWNSDNQPSLYSITVTPGDAKVVRHADVEIRALLVGFDSDSIKLQAKYENQPSWEEAQMHPDPQGGGFVFRFFDVRENIDYLVEADGIRSDSFTIQVSDLPAVEKLRIELTFPRRTGLENRVQEDDGDIRALIGTLAHLQVETDQPVRSGKVKLEESGEIELRLVSPTVLEGSFKIERDDFYRIQLQNLEDVWSPATDEYLIEAHIDQPPGITFTRPGRDKKVTNLEEVFVEVKAEDDYGLSRLNLNYSVNGEEEASKRLDSPSYARSATASHTFYLEEYDLVPGDFVSYYAEAYDALSNSKTDIYFLEVLPYDREFTQSQQSGGGAGGGEQLQLSRAQKEIIAATFNMLRDQKNLERKEFEENVQTIGLMQRQLQQQAVTIVERIKRRGAATDTPMFRQMLQNLEQAVEFMESVHQQLSRFQPKQALPPEQKALQRLLRTESLFKQIQIAMAGSGGNGSSSSAEDLADLVDLELDRTKNQYETLQADRQHNQEQVIDEAARKLKELAQRQKQELERQRRLGSQSSSGGRASQQQILEEVEKLARELERLSRQKRDQQLRNLSRQLQQTARQLRRGMNSRNAQQAQAQAQQALERLRSARDQLDRQRESEMEASIDQMAQKSGELARRQEETIGRMQELDDRHRTDDLDTEAFKQLWRLLREKSELLEDLQSLESGLHRSARRLEFKEKIASRKLKQAGNQIRDQRTPEKMQEGSELLRRGWTTLAKRREESVAQDLRQLSDAIRQAQEALGQNEGSNTQQQAEATLDQLGNLVEDLESLYQRTQAGARAEDRASQQQDPSDSQQDPSSQQRGGQSRPGAQARQDREGQDQEPGQAQQVPADEVGSTGGGPPSNWSQSQRAPIDSSPAAESKGIDPQLQREWGERIRDAERIHDLLRGVDRRRARDLAKLARMMRTIDAQRLFNDLEEVARLKSQIIDGFRQLELQLYRSLEPGRDRLQLTHDDEVPPQYRDRVEQYYRSLAGETKRP